MRAAPLLIALVLALPAAQAQPAAHARALFDARNWDAARQEYTALARANPNDHVPLLFLGRIALQQNEVATRSSCSNAASR